MFLLLFIAIQFSWPQNFIKDRIVASMNEKLQTEIRIDHLEVDFPKKVIITGLYIEDRAGDTLLYGGVIKVDINLFQLLSKKIVITDVIIQDAFASIVRSDKDIVYNFDFLFTAFKDTAKASDTAAPWEYDLKQLTLSNVDFRLNDSYDGLNINSHIGKLYVSMSEFDPDGGKYYVNTIEASNSFFDYSDENKHPDEKKPRDMDLQVSNARFDKVKVKYLAGTDNVNLDMGKVEIAINEINNESKKIDIEKIHISGTALNYLTLKNPETESAISKADKEGWDIVSNEIIISQSNLNYNNNSTPRKDSFDPDHLALANINGRINDLSLIDSEIKADIRNVSLQNRHGVNLRHLSTRLTLTDNHLELAGLNLQTDRSKISNYISLSYPSLEAIAENIEDLRFNATLIGSRINTEDLVYFNPDLKNKIPSELRNNTYNVSGKITGEMADLHLNNFSISTKDNTRLAGNAHIKGLPNVNTAYYDIRVSTLTASMKQIRPFIPDSIYNAYTLPSAVNASGNFKGTLSDFTTHVNIKSDLGNAVADMKINKMTATRNKAFKGTITASNLELGKILKNPDLGEFSFTANINGTGLKKENLDATLQAVVSEAVYKGYSYNNITIDGAFKQKQFTGQASMSDNNIAFAFSGGINFSRDQPEFNFTMDLYGADLQALNLAKKDLRVKARIESRLTGSTLNNLTGTFGIHDALILSNGNKYPVDSLLFVTISKTSDTAIVIKSDLMNGYVTGSINPGDLWASLSKDMNSYFKFTDNISANRPLQPQNFELVLNIENTTLITDIFMPSVSALDPFSMYGKYNSAEKNIVFNTSLPLITYSDLRMDSLKFNLNTNAQKLEYALEADDAKRESMHFIGPIIKGEAANNKLTTRFSLLDKKRQEKLVVGGTLSSLRDYFEFSLNPGEVVFDYNKWSVPSDNYIRFKDKLTSVHNLDLRYNGEFVSANTVARSSRDSVLEVKFGNLNLDKISAFLTQGDTLFSGLVNGQMVFEDYHTKFGFTSDVTITGFGYRGDIMGDVKLLADNASPDRYNINLTLLSNVNNVSARGYLLSNTKSSGINLDVDIQKLDLNTVQSLALGHATEMSGKAHGKINISGTLGEPMLKGQLELDNALVNLAYFNSDFFITNEKLVFDEQGLTLNTFTMLDSLGNKAVIDGKVLTRNYKDYYYSLTARTTNFMLFNTTKPGDNMFFGKVFITSTTEIKGTSEIPIVVAHAKLNKGTDITITVPQAQLERVERKGIVEFVDKDEKLAAIFLREDTDTIRTKITGIILNSDIEVDRNTVVRVLIDPASGDNLMLRGGGLLSYDIDRSGGASLTGRYDIEGGAYKLSFYTLIRKEFEIQPGGNITWTGNPYAGEIDLTAIYKVQTSPLELMENTAAGVGVGNTSVYRQRLPFEVYINVNGTIVHPIIDFDIDLEEEQRNAFGGSVYARLQQINANESEVNLQAFSLIALNRFSGEDPFAGGDNPASAFARTSVSKVLSQQLNRLSGKFIPGVDVNFDVQSYTDYTSGYAEDRTDLGVNLSKQFANQRVTVAVGSSFGLQGGESRTNANTGNDFAGDASVEYNVTRDGSVRLKAFRENEYEGLIEGQVTETGVSAVYTRDYDVLSELFTKPEQPEAILNEEKKKTRKERRQEKKNNNNPPPPEEKNISENEIK